MPLKAIVHIGPMKTGSSSIQFWLGKAKGPLKEAGFLVPTSFGALNMSRLSNIAQAIASGNEIAESDAKRLNGLRDEIANLPDSIDAVVFSGEMIGQQLKSEAELAAFKSLLGEFFDDYTIIVYLRRQDELSLSRYSTALRRGSKRASPLAEPLDYEKILEPWAKAFGRDALKPRIFDREVMPQGDVVRDFAQAAGLPLVATGDAPLDRNPSLLPEAQIFLADLAARVRDAGFTDSFMEAAGHGFIIKRLGQEFRGKGLKPARADAIAFYETMRESNERIRAAWFPERTTLFSEDFSSYSEEATAAPSTERVLEVAMSALVAVLTRTKGQADVADGGAGVQRRSPAERKEMRLRRSKRRKVGGRGRKTPGQAKDL